MSPDIKQLIHEFLNKHPFCVVSTVTVDSAPEAAFVGFSHSDNLEFVIGTSKLSRKYKNLQTNPKIALVVADTACEVQYEGDTQEVTHQEYEHLVEANFFQKLPGAEKYRDDPNQVFLKITPTWLRFIQHRGSDQINEFTEF